MEEVNAVQKELFKALEPTLGREDAAVVMGSMTMKYFSRLSINKEDLTLDKDSHITSMLESFLAHSTGMRKAWPRKCVSLPLPSKSLLHRTQEQVHRAPLLVTSLYPLSSLLFPPSVEVHRAYFMDLCTSSSLYDLVTKNFAPGGRLWLKFGVLI